jgi:broad specificity phosphatase PhoE
MFLEKRIFLLRHGETEWNTQRRLQGNRNSPLTPRGIEQANNARQSLLKYSIDHAYVSPLERAINTAEIILEGRDVNLTINDDFREINLGPWEGKTWQEAKLSHPVEFSNYYNNPELFSLPGADTFQELQNRMVGGLEFIFSCEKGSNLLVVSHGMAIKVAIAYYTSTSLTNLSSIIDPINCSFLCLSKRGNDVFIQKEP